MLAQSLSKFIVLKDMYVNTCLKYIEDAQSCTIILYIIHCANEDRQESITFVNKILRDVSQMYVKWYKACLSNKNNNIKIIIIKT